MWLQVLPNLQKSRIIHLECCNIFNRRNVDCDGKSDDETEDNSQATSTTSTQAPEESAPKSGKKKEQTLEEVLAAIKEAGMGKNTIMFLQSNT